MDLLSISMIEALNNREIASIVWIAVMLLWALNNHDFRASLVGLFKVSTNKNIVVALFLMLLYVMFLVFIFFKIGFWDESALKDTVFWTIFSAFAMCINITHVSQNDAFFKKAILDNLKIALIFEFIINLYTFSIPAELALTFFIFLVSLISVFIESKSKYAPLVKPLKFIQGIILAFVLFFTFREIVHDFSNFATFKTLRDFTLPIALSVGFLPFIYFFALLIQYETFFIRIDFANNKNTLSKFAKKAVIRACHLNLSKLNKVSKKAGFPKIEKEENISEWFKLEIQ